MSGVLWGWFRDGNATAHLGFRAATAGRAGAVCGVEVIDEIAPDDVDAASLCESCCEVHDDLAAGRQLRAWRERGDLFTCQQASDVVAVHVGALKIHVWRHPDGALIEALDRGADRHAAYVSMCRDPEVAGAKAVMLAVSHGSQCAERPLWPLTEPDLQAVPVASD